MNRKKFSAFSFWFAVFALLLLTAARPSPQFAGCVRDEDQAHAARFIIRDVYDLRFTVTAIGLGSFDPQIMIVDEDGRLVGCNNNKPSANPAYVDLPTATAGIANTTAHMSVRYYADENPDTGARDYTVFITEANGNSGEFVLLYHGAGIADGNDTDTFSVITTPQQIAHQTPLRVYAINADRSTGTLNPVLTLSFGGVLRLECLVSDFSDYCNGQTLPLAGFYVVLADGTRVEAQNTDVLLLYEPDAAEREYTISLSPYQLSSYGQYVLALHWGVAYP